MRCARCAVVRPVKLVCLLAHSERRPPRTATARPRRSQPPRGLGRSRPPAATPSAGALDRGARAIPPRASRLGLTTSSGGRARPLRRRRTTDAHARTGDNPSGQPLGPSAPTPATRPASAATPGPWLAAYQSAVLQCCGERRPVCHRRLAAPPVGRASAPPWPADRFAVRPATARRRLSDAERPRHGADRTPAQHTPAPAPHQR
jgi:hypothetical protein